MFLSDSLAAMEPIKEYRIIDSQDLHALADQVNAALNEGWQPYGDPLVQTSGMALAGCCQAMVKFRKPTGGEKIAEVRRR